MTNNGRRILIAVFIFLVCIFSLIEHSQIQNLFGFPMFNFVKRYSFQSTHSKNIVTSIYLSYRYFDTIIETFVLAFATISVSYMNLHKKGEN